MGIPLTPTGYPPFRRPSSDSDHLQVAAFTARTANGVQASTSPAPHGVAAGGSSAGATAWAGRGVSGLDATGTEAEPGHTPVTPGGAASPRILGVGTAVSPVSYSQGGLLDIFQVEDSRIRSVFLHGGIERRHLVLPPLAPDGKRRVESQGELLAKHASTGLRMGHEALAGCLKRAGASVDEVAHLCCVSSTGFLTPGFSALLLKEMELPRHCARLDVVGMGCNAGLNALGAVAAWAAAHPGELAVLVCIEACSAAYVFDGTMRTSVVNSLFGDGAAAIAVRVGHEEPAAGPSIVGFSSWIIPDAIGAMRYDWDHEHGKFSFYLAPDVPYVVGAQAPHPVDHLLSQAGLRRSDVAHWIIHSGGKKVVDAVRVNLRLTRHDVRHTLSVLRDYGNLSSGSFLFSYERLLDEGIAQAGDIGVLMTMGPGSTIETALVRW